MADAYGLCVQIQRPLGGASDGLPESLTVETLMEAGPDAYDLEPPRDLRPPPLVKAAVDQNFQALRALLAKPDTNIDEAGFDCVTALGVAAETGWRKGLLALLAAGADMEAGEGTRTGTPFLRACLSGQTAMATILLDRGANIRAKLDDNAQCVLLASENGHNSTVRMLLQRGADLNATGRNGTVAMHMAAMQGHADTIKMLLELGQDVNALDDKTTPLGYAAQNGHVPSVKALLAHPGVKVDHTAPGNPAPLWYAYRHPRVVELLIQAGADVNVAGCLPVVGGCGVTLLHHAAFDNVTETIRLAARAGADLEARIIETGWTPLHVAARTSSLAAVRALLACGADPRATDKEGRTPLRLAESYVLTRAGVGPRIMEDNAAVLRLLRKATGVQPGSSSSPGATRDASQTVVAAAAVALASATLEELDGKLSQSQLLEMMQEEIRKGRRVNIIGGSGGKGAV